MALLALIGNVTFSQTTDPANAQLSEYTTQEKLLDATIMCLDALLAPTKHNEWAKPFLAQDGFPQNVPGSSEEGLKQAILDWFKARPAVLENVLVERKKAHDKLYGTRPY